jgi:uncharacterized protein YnzC (UPF0291/DUF896 family)
MSNTPDINTIMRKQFEHDMTQKEKQTKLRLDHYREEYFDSIGITVWEKYPCCFVVDHVDDDIIKELDLAYGNSELLMDCEHIIDVPNLNEMVDYGGCNFKHLSKETRELLTYISAIARQEGYVILRH